MSYREHLPHPALRPFVDRFWTRAAGPSATEARVLPDGCIDVMLMLADGACSGIFVVGTMTEPLVIPAGPGARHLTVAVRFRPGGARPFLRADAHQLTDQRIDGTALGLGWLAAADGLPALERALLGRLSSVPGPDPLVAHAVNQLLSESPPSVEALARRIGYSRQHLGRRFRAEVGIGPKELARVARIQRAVAGLQCGRPALPLADLAARAGYFDQAHMDRDFRQLVGVTPQVARGLPGSIRPIASLFPAA